MIKLRLDVDYAFPSRLKSFIFTAINRKTNGNYLKNSKTIARMINESPREVKAYWFFTQHTIPDRELLELLTPARHEIGLHIANDPYRELERLEKATNRKITYYTVHGTARLLARIIWKRKLWQNRAPIPKDFPLQSFYEFPTLGLDRACHENSPQQANKIAEKAITKGEVLHIHPEWLFQRGTINHRGPYYETLKTILDVDHDIERISLARKSFLAVAKDAAEYHRDLTPTAEFVRKLRARQVDVFTFIERTWISSIPNPNPQWIKTEDNVGLLRVTSYEKWLKDIMKKTRHNMVRKAERLGIRTEIVTEVTPRFVQEVWRIYNETPIRQGRAFPHYGIKTETLKQMLLTENCTLVAAYLQDELVGYMQMSHGDNTAILSQILSLQKHWDKAVTNALIAKAVEICDRKKISWLLYGRMETAHPSLDSFKRHNGFAKFTIPRYYIPLTQKGKIAIKLGLHREMKDALPKQIKYPLIPLYNWTSRTKMKLKLKLQKARIK